ncbi:Mannan endo-1,4-beta-mannosidase 2 [Acorus gramineus]|uniref:Mannan endo-1,4-beta-mannosidase 2 n=1 Tax=Acorus gramineus TaxID=55184 RepID=A0AAV9BSE6_ACOGR|nr:Mannan endo-1,4-beta-mannosidase 2 [Acorus gramineus]
MLGRLGFCVIALLILLVCQNALLVAGDDDFVRVSGSHFVLHGRSFYSNGFNAYWLLDRASDPTQRHLVTDAFKHATEPGMSIVRTWATCGGGGQPLQLSPGKYDEDMFRVRTS